jgi:hypothetical protein
LTIIARDRDWAPRGQDGGAAALPEDKFEAEVARAVNNTVTARQTAFEGDTATIREPTGGEVRRRCSVSASAGLAPGVVARPLLAPPSTRCGATAPLAVKSGNASLAADAKAVETVIRMCDPEFNAGN